MAGEFKCYFCGKTPEEFRKEYIDKWKDVNRHSYEEKASIRNKKYERDHMNEKRKKDEIEDAIVVLKDYNEVKEGNLWENVRGHPGCKLYGTVLDDAFVEKYGKLDYKTMELMRESGVLPDELKTARLIMGVCHTGKTLKEYVEYSKNALKDIETKAAMPMPDFVIVTADELMEERFHNDFVEIKLDGITVMVCPLCRDVIRALQL